MVALFFGCSSGKQITQIQNEAQADYAAGDFAKALSEFEGIINNYESQGKSQACPVYSQAGIAAYRLGDLTKALDYLKKATYTPFADEQTYITMAKAYRNIDNLSLEIETLEKYIGKYPEGAEVMPMKIRLFETYVESENWQEAYDLWPQIEPKVRADIKYIEDYYYVNKALGNREKTDELASQLLEMNDENIIGLEYEAKKYYNIAEDRYQAEMKAYEANKTRKQYAALLKALEDVTDEFKMALKYFETLYKIDPKPSYATYIGNIYTRFNDKEKADYYHQLGKKKQ
jgi:tetratricopeptide (TPR) repeat protein